MDVEELRHEELICWIVIGFCFTISTVFLGMMFSASLWGCEFQHPYVYLPFFFMIVSIIIAGVELHRVWKVRRKRKEQLGEPKGQE